MEGRLLHSSYCTLLLLEILNFSLQTEHLVFILRLRTLDSLFATFRAVTFLFLRLDAVLKNFLFVLKLHYLGMFGFNVIHDLSLHVSFDLEFIFSSA